MSDEYHRYARCGIVGGILTGGTAMGTLCGIAARYNKGDIIAITVALSPFILPCMATIGYFVAGYCCLSSEKRYTQ